MIPLKNALFIFVLTAIVAVSLVGCDTTADRELRRAEKALDEALEINADAYATDDYRRAEELLEEAAALANDGRIQEAREAAIKCKLRAEDAKRKAEERHQILDAEMDELGR